MRELEGLHASAAEELEGLYEARLAVEAEKLRQMSATKDDLELHFKVCCVVCPGAVQWARACHCGIQSGNSRRLYHAD
jgi:hypothetical protein